MKFAFAPTPIPPLTRYSWKGAASPIAVALSIKKDDAFFSHASALWIHGLSNDDQNFFVNKEQSPKPQTASPLSQDGIDRAFQNQQRRSKLSYKYQGARISLLNGKHSARLAVEPAKARTGHKLDVTSIERTLIDITVRPAYAARTNGLKFNFYLSHGMKKPAFDSSWRIFYPSQLK
jgi:hypothetical protein